MKNDVIYLWNDEKIASPCGRPWISTMLLNDSKEHPAILIIPGGGYHTVCHATEGEPIGKKFNSLGFHAFVLNYRIAPCRWPEPQLDAMRAMKIIRANAAKWRVDVNHIAACGFSAGAHLAGSLGVLCDKLNADCDDECDKFSHKPNAMILCYGVLSFASWSHQGSEVNLFGKQLKTEWKKYSLEQNVTEDTPPTFLMHTVCDKTVNYKNSVEFANALAAKGVPFELKLCYWGEHGTLLGLKTRDLSLWPLQAKKFLLSLQEYERKPKEFLQKYTGKTQAELEKKIKL